LQVLSATELLQPVVQQLFQLQMTAQLCSSVSQVRAELAMVFHSLTVYRCTGACSRSA
jgi:hypothetical protein